MVVLTLHYHYYYHYLHYYYNYHGNSYHHCYCCYYQDRFNSKYGLKQVSRELFSLKKNVIC